MSYVIASAMSDPNALSFMVLDASSADRYIYLQTRQGRIEDSKNDSPLPPKKVPDSPSQLWNFEPVVVPQGPLPVVTEGPLPAFKIVSVANGTVLDLPNDSTEIGTPIGQNPDNGGPNQRWIFRLAADDPIQGIAFHIIADNGLVLDARGASTAAGTPIQQDTRHDVQPGDLQSMNQWWYVLPGID